MDSVAMRIIATLASLMLFWAGGLCDLPRAADFAVKGVGFAFGDRRVTPQAQPTFARVDGSVLAVWVRTHTPKHCVCVSGVDCSPNTPCVGT